MSEFTVLTYINNRLMDSKGFDHYPDASQYAFEQSQNTSKLTFYITKTLAMSKSKEVK